METIFEIDDIDQPQEKKTEKKPKKEPKIKKKKEMSEERRQALREQLSRGRATLAKKREQKKTVPKDLKKEPVPKKEKPKDKLIQVLETPELIEPKTKDLDLRKEISELKKLILEGRGGVKEVMEKPIKIQQEKKEAERQEPKREKPKLIQVLETPQLIQPPKKKKRSLLGGGIILNLNRF